MKNIKLTEDEKVILKNINKDYKWIARDDNGSLFIYGEKPIKKESSWISKMFLDWFNMCIFNHLFLFIKWEDEEPYLIEDLLKEDDYDEEENGVPFDDEE